VQLSKVLLFDIETNGLLPELDRIHCLVIKDPTTGDVFSCSDAPAHTGPSVDDGLRLLEAADAIAGHNIVGFDLPAIWKIHPEWGPRFRTGGPGVVRDTIVMARLVWPSERIRDMDFTRVGRGVAFPKQLIGRFSLEAFGYRLGEYKGDYKGGWDSWSAEMQDYCVQDVEVTHRLWDRLIKELTDWGIDPLDPAPPAGKDCVQLEHDVARIIARQEQHGFAFDRKAALTLMGKLAGRRAELTDDLQRVFPPKVIETPFIPKSNNSKLGYRKGELFIKRRTEAFNPSSRRQVAERLMELGWKPDEFNMDGTPKVDDDTLSSLPYEPAQVLAEYFMVTKRLGAIGEGKEAWLRADRGGRIHGRVETNGAVTGRMTHQRPNMAQVPGNAAPYGHECRSLFTASAGRVLVGCDADALELRCLAHFMARYDGGAYIETVLAGKKEEGTDMHTLNAKALGCDRDTAKTWFYAFIYGAGDWKLGYTLTGKKGPRRKIAAIGAKAREDFLAALPAMGKLVKAVKAAAKRGWLLGIDGRHISIRSDHAALNSLLQSAGAVVMKRAMILLDAAAAHAAASWEFSANVHDEWQIDAEPMVAEELGRCAASSIAYAGDFYSFRCPLKGNHVIGKNWAETH